jgi:hypothetical protein
MLPMQDRTEEIKREIAELNNSLKMSVHKAIRIGELLVEQKEIVGHGFFTQWIENNLDITDRTAQKYMKLFQYHDKTELNSDLQDAYKQIETIEAQEKLSKEELDRSIISEFRKTGIKPQGWTAKHEKAVRDTDAHLENIKSQRSKEEAEREANKTRRQQENSSSDLFTEALSTATSNMLAKHKEREDWKAKLRLSGDNKDSAFMDAIIDYMETLENDNRRIEACNNIIKICRKISVELQKTAN